MADYAQDAVLIIADGSLKRSFAKYGHCSERAYSPRPARLRFAAFVGKITTARSLGRVRPNRRLAETQELVSRFAEINHRGAAAKAAGFDRVISSAGNKPKPAGDFGRLGQADPDRKAEDEAE